MSRGLGDVYKRQELDDGYDDDHVSNLMPKVKNAVRLKVDETEEVGIVSSFTT